VERSLEVISALEQQGAQALQLFPPPVLGPRDPALETVPQAGDEAGDPIRVVAHAPTLSAQKGKATRSVAILLRNRRTRRRINTARIIAG
jgi:hypothetical protein